MATKSSSTKKSALNLIATLHDAYTDFILSRQAKLCSQNTMLFYKFTVGLFVKWLEGKGIDKPNQVHARHVREYLAELKSKNKSDGTISDHARGIRVLVKFWYAEDYLIEPIVFEIPKPPKKRLPTLNSEQLQMVIKSLNDNLRNKVIIMFMADCGLRRNEVIKLNWNDVDMNNGLVKVRQGKGKKDRSVVIGATVRRVLLKYRRVLENNADNSPLFQTREGTRFTPKGFREIFTSISKKVGFKVTCHGMRRTFAILSLRAGMSPLHLQALGGWEGLEMVKHYAQLEEEDLLEAHRVHSPVDNL